MTFRSGSALVLLVCAVLCVAQPVFAQSEGAQDAKSQKADSYSCMVEGREAASNVSTGGAFGIGFVSGLCLGLIGTAVAYVAQGPPAQLPEERYSSLNDASCRMAFKDGYNEAGRKKKKGAALVGGLLGTAAFVLVAVSASSGSN
jgi:hypothetical protein